MEDMFFLTELDIYLYVTGWKR